MSPNPIILYDLASKYKDYAFSLNTVKIRLILTYKGLPFKTEWLEVPEIKQKSEELGISPTSKKPDGSPHYTVPAIYDPRTDKYISDSFLIAEYLDTQYPDTPRVFPDGTLSLQHAYVSAFEKQFLAVSQLLVESMVKVLNPISERNARERFIKKPVLNEEERKEKWGKVKAIFSLVDESIRKGRSNFLGGEKPIFADFMVGAWMRFLEATVGRDQDLWQDFLTWNDGRWAERRETFTKWITY